MSALKKDIPLKRVFLDSRLQVTLRVSSQEELLWECGHVSVRSWFCLVILWHIFSAWAECNLQSPWQRTNT